MPEVGPEVGGHKLDRKQWIAVGVGALGILVTVFLYLRSRSSSGSSTAETLIPNANGGLGLNAGNANTGSADNNTALLSGILAQLQGQSSSGSSNSNSSYLTPNLGDVPVWLHTAPNATSPVGTIADRGAHLTSAGAAVQGGSYTSPQLNVTGNEWIPISWEGTTLYAFGPEVKRVTGSGGRGPSQHSLVRWPFSSHPLHDDPWDSGLDRVTTGQVIQLS